MVRLGGAFGGGGFDEITERGDTSVPSIGGTGDGLKVITDSLGSLAAITQGFINLKRREKDLYTSGKYTLAEMYDEMELKYLDLGVNLAKLDGGDDDIGTVSDLLAAMIPIKWPIRLQPGAEGGGLFVDWDVDVDNGSGDGELTFQGLNSVRVTDFITSVPELGDASNRIRLSNSENTNDGMFLLKASVSSNVILIDGVLPGTDNLNDSTMILTLLAGFIA